MAFKKITLGDRDIINRFYKGTRQWFSEYTFSTSFAWNCGGYSYAYKVEEDILYVAITQEASGNAILLKPVALSGQLTPEDMLAAAKREKVDLFLCIDNHYFDKFDSARWDKYFTVTEDVKWSNYYYLVQDLAELKGSKYSKKRNLIKQFMREYGNHNVEVKACSAPLIDRCIRLHVEWYENKRDLDSPDLKRELEALSNSLKNFEALGLEGMGLFIDEQMKAFMVFEELNSETMVVHFEKTIPGYKGLPQYFLSQASTLMKDRYKYMNREGDMGDEGLRKAKLSIRPVFMERSIRLKVKDV